MSFLMTVQKKWSKIVDDSNLMHHYRICVANLETLFVKSCKKFDPSLLDSKEIIQSILKKENMSYSGVLKLLFILFTLRM